jgi:hypothetical protein
MVSKNVYINEWLVKIGKEPVSDSSCDENGEIAMRNSNP